MIDRIRALSAALLLTLLLSPAAMADEAQDQQVEIGVKAYDDGDYPRAKDILLPLAEAGHPKAMNMVGLMHSKGKGYSKHRQVACDWYERSAETGYISGIYNLSLCYHLGEGRANDPKLGWALTERAAQLGHIGAQGDIAGRYVDTERDLYLFWAKKAATSGNARAKVLMWLKGDGEYVPDLTFIEIVCVVVKIAWMDDRYDACD